ncbi:MAG: hypothetical protein OXN94_17815 [Chloroflexota bacterium]|nr:hypothetical protein [Chloroflexota bacterium]
MSINLDKASDFVHQHGTLFERALFDYLFAGGSSERVQAIIMCYKNPDGGFGHGFEHDLKAPQSNPLALEYLLSVMKHTGIAPGVILDGVSDWVESQMDEAGNLRNPPETRHYPLAPWWREEGGQTMPDSIVANLITFDCAEPALIMKTKGWVAERHTLESIRANEWLFMAYHAVDFFFAIDEFPDLERYRAATIDNVLACAKAAPESQYDSLFAFAPAPDSIIAKALPADLLVKYLDVLEGSQTDDGSWVDQHNLRQWRPMTTINVLLALQRYGRWSSNR